MLSLGLTSQMIYYVPSYRRHTTTQRCNKNEPRTKTESVLFYLHHACSTLGTTSFFFFFRTYIRIDNEDKRLVKRHHEVDVIRLVFSSRVEASVPKGLTSGFGGSLLPSQSQVWRWLALRG